MVRRVPAHNYTCDGGEAGVVTMVGRQVWCRVALCLVDCGDAHSSRAARGKRMQSLLAQLSLSVHLPRVLCTE